jgi:nucleoside-diphosphate-sugar epimerase
MILVTGATGFIGRRLVRRLLESRAELVCLVRDGEEIPGVRCLPVDLRTGRGLTAAPRSPELVYHLASDIDTGHRDHRIDDLGTQLLYQAIGPLGPNARFVYTSSIAVADNRPATGPARADTRLGRPHNEYGRRKLLAEGYLAGRCAHDGFTLEMPRLCAIWGRGNRVGGVFHQAVTLARADLPIARFDWPGRLSLMYVEDAARLLAAMGAAPLHPGSAEITMPVTEVLALSEIIEAVYAAMDKPYRPLRLPRAFWTLCRTATHRLLTLEPLLPHLVSNKLWQLGLTVNDALHADGRPPEGPLVNFRDAVSELLEP